jgi:Family of unknown function (DUF5829)
MILPALLIALAPQDPPPLLAETPEGWRGERLDFPLDFAPDLGLAGFEQLRFAPGMFDPEAPGYWSYLLAVRLEGEHLIDGAFLERFLGQYYEGLCRAVAEGRFDLSQAEFKVQVTRRGGGFAARVQLVDAFATGQPLELALELEVDPGVVHTDLFAIASPAEGQAEIWKTLRAVRDGWLSSRPERLFLNHAYVVVDAETYAALAGSEFLRGAFAACEQRETVRPDLTYGGLYLYGRHTYLEFLTEGDAPQLQPGSSGIAFGVERAGGLAQVAASLKTAQVPTFPGAVSRGLGDRQVPWFRMLGIQAAHPSSRLSLFCMAYEASFLGEWHPGLSRATGIGRAPVLERYRAAGGDDEGGLEEITDVYLDLDGEERARLAQVVTAMGWRVVRSERSWRLDGPGVDLHVAVGPAASPGRVTGFDLSLAGGLAPQTVVLGAARLEVEGERARLRLGARK